MLRQRALYRGWRLARVVGPALLHYRILALRNADTARWDRAHDRFAKGLAGLGNDLGGLFVKLCQVAGARADVMPPAFVRELGLFHDRVPPRPWSELEPAVEQALGRPIDDVFERVDQTPLAAASLAQVHRGWLRGGEAVVLKVQYPEAARLYGTDLALVRRAVGIADRVFRGLPVRGAVDDVARFIGLELDFEREAASTERVAAAFAGDPELCIPRLHRSLCTDRLLVLEFLDGTPIHDTAALTAAGVSLPALADRVAALYRRMIFEQGFFHGDPHPGNLLVLRDGRIGLLDFGLAKELPPGFAEGIARMFACSAGGDRAGAVKAARGLGFQIGGEDPDGFARLLGIALGARHDLGELQSALASSTVAGVPPDVALVVRTLVLLNGLSERLAPGERRIPRALVAAFIDRLRPTATPPAPGGASSPRSLAEVARA